MGHADYYVSANHETASKFVGQRIFAANYSAGKWAGLLLHEANNGGGLLLDDPVQWGPNGTCLARETDEEACICHSLDRIACVGANEIVTQGRDRPCRQLRTDRPDGRTQAGVFNEMRELPGAPATTHA